MHIPRVKYSTFGCTSLSIRLRNRTIRHGYATETSGDIGKRAVLRRQSEFPEPLEMTN